MGSRLRRAAILIGGLVLGFILLIVGIVLISTAGPNEIPLWYGVTLCPTSDVPNYYISQNLLPAGACPTILFSNESQIQEFVVEKDVFSDDGLEYHPIIYRNTESATVQFKLEDANGKLLLAEGPVTVSNDKATSSSKRSVVEDEDDIVEGGMRKLMKGGRTVGTSGRGRSGSSGRFGTGTRVTRTSYGYSSCCVSSYTAVYVYNPGPRYRTGVYGTSASRSNCGDPKDGCEYELSSNMNRDEFSQLSFVANGDHKYPLKLTVARASTTSSAGVEPQLYFTFWTSDPDNNKVASYLLLPLGCLLIAGSVIYFFVATFCCNSYH